VPRDPREPASVATRCVLATLALLVPVAGTTGTAEQLGIMLQNGNMLPASNRFGRRTPEVDRQYALLQQAGARWARDGIEWAQIETRRGEWNWSAADTVVEAANRHRVGLVWLVGNTATWDSSNGEWNGVPRDLDNPGGLFPQFVHRLVERYHDRIHAWEIRNEPNLDYMFAGHSAERYAVYLTQASHAIREVDPRATVVLGGLGGSIKQQVTFFDALMAALRRRGGELPFTVAAFHIYPAEADSAGFHGRRAVTRYLAWCNEQITKVLTDANLRAMPVWITEFDFPAARERQPDDPDFNRGPDSQVRAVRELFTGVVSGRPGWKVFWASLLDDWDDDGFQSCGLVTSDKGHHIGSPRPSYRAMEQLLHQR
jgi:hypothetical protein